MEDLVYLCTFMYIQVIGVLPQRVLTRWQHYGPMNVVGGDATDLAKGKILREMVKHVWPHDQPGIKARVVVALGFLAGAKVSYHYCVAFFSSLLLY